MFLGQALSYVKMRGAKTLIISSKIIIIAVIPTIFFFVPSRNTNASLYFFNFNSALIFYSMSYEKFAVALKFCNSAFFLFSF